MKTILCIKAGTKYSSEYVNMLYKMVKRSTRQDFKFVCLTDDPLGISSEVKTYPLLTTDPTIQGWWHKILLFGNNVHDITGTVLYLDLDIVLTGPLDPFLDHPGYFCILKEWTLGESKYNSSIMRFNIGQYSYVWDEFLKTRPDGFGKNFDPTTMVKGDQDWISKKVDATTYPEEWYTSFKVHGRDKKLPEGEFAVIFHGKPNPHEADKGYGKSAPCKWVKYAWRDHTSQPIVLYDSYSDELGHQNYFELSGSIVNQPTNLLVGSSVNKIVSENKLQQLSFLQVREKLIYWKNLLMIGGSIEIEVSDLARAALMIVDGNPYHEKDAINIMYGSTVQYNSGFTFLSLLSLLEEIGFSGVERLEVKNNKLRVKAWR